MNLGPALRGNSLTKDIKLMIIDTNRYALPTWADTVRVFITWNFWLVWFSGLVNIGTNSNSALLKAFLLVLFQNLFIKKLSQENLFCLAHSEKITRFLFKMSKKNFLRPWFKLASTFHQATKLSFLRFWPTKLQLVMLMESPYIGILIKTAKLGGWMKLIKITQINLFYTQRLEK